MARVADCGDEGWKTKTNGFQVLRGAAEGGAKERTAPRARPSAPASQTPAIRGGRSM